MTSWSQSEKLFPEYRGEGRTIAATGLVFCQPSTDGLTSDPSLRERMKMKSKIWKKIKSRSTRKSMTQ